MAVPKKIAKTRKTAKTKKPKVVRAKTVSSEEIILPLAIGRLRRTFFLLSKRIKAGQIDLVIATSRNGIKFSQRPQLIHLKKLDGQDEDLSVCRGWRLGGENDELIITYVRDKASGPALVYATTKDKKIWSVAGAFVGVATPGVFLPKSMAGQTGAIYYGPQTLQVATTKNWRSWTITQLNDAPDKHFFDGRPFETLAVWPARDDIAVLYGTDISVDVMTDFNLNNQKIGEEQFLKIGAALFSRRFPEKLLYQAELPVLELPMALGNNLSIIGAMSLGERSGRWRIYLVSPRGKIGFLDLEEELLFDGYKQPLTLTKAQHNPILSPTEHIWENEGTFNPTAVYLGGKVHLLYRAVGAGGYSLVGYASSDDGFIFDERVTKPIYIPRERFEGGPGSGPSGHDAGLFGSGGGWGGCEDPKVTLIDDRLYMTYVAHNGYWPMRTALTSISVDDFLAKRWRWSKPMIMSPPGIGSKSVIILPEKVNGQYIIFHRVWPDIVVDVVPELEFGEGKRWLGKEYKIPPRHSYWDSQKLSLGAAPIKTTKGWLAIYNAVDRRDSSRYKIGAMLLDLEEPWRVIARSRQPILSPDQWYENAGKPGVAYPGGAVDKNGILYVYYGGADRVCCVATIPINELVEDLLASRDPSFKKLSPVVVK